MGSEPKPANSPLLELDDPGGPASPASVRGSDSRDSLTGSTVRERMQTVTDEVALEEARLESLPSNMPPPRPPTSTAIGAAGPVTVVPPARDSHDSRDRSRDSSVEIDAGESDIDELGPEEQVAILRARLAPVTRIPELARAMSQLGVLLEDPKTAYILGFVDGILPLETIVDVTGLPELDTLRVLDRMVTQSVIVFR